MVQVPQQVLSNLNLHLTAEAPAQQAYGYEEEMYNNRRRDENMYNEEGVEEYPRSMYGQETSPDSDYEDEYDNGENFDYGQRNRDYDQEYRENIDIGNFGYSPDIIGGAELINYDSPYSNNSFDDREIIDNGGKPYGDWWNLDNILGDVNISKGAQKNDLVGFGVSDVSDLIGLSHEKIEQPSFNDMFGFSGINTNGTLGRTDEYDPQSMFGFKEFVNKVGGIGKKAFVGAVKTANVIRHPVRSAQMAVAKAQDELEGTSNTANDENSHQNQLKQKFAEEDATKQRLKEDEIKNRQAVALALAREGKTIESVNRGSGSNGSARVPFLEVKAPTENVKSFEGVGGNGADIFGFQKLREDVDKDGLGNPDIFGFASMRDNDVGETDTFGFRQMGESESEGATAQSIFGFKIGSEGAQTAEDVFGSLGGHANSPMSFSDTFGFKDESSVPQSMSNVFGIHIVGYDQPEVAPVTSVGNPVKSPTLDESLGKEKAPEVRADLSSLSSVSQPKQVYKTTYKPTKKAKAKFEYPVPQVPAVNSNPAESPQTHKGMYNRMGKLLGDNQDYASNFSGYGYNLDVGGMFNGNDNDQLVGFNSDVIGIGLGALPTKSSKNRKIRVTSYTITGGKVTGRSTKVNGKYVEKKTKKSKNASKKKATCKNKTVKKGKSKPKSEDDYLSKLIWGE